MLSVSLVFYFGIAADEKYEKVLYVDNFFLFVTFSLDDETYDRDFPSSRYFI